MSSLPQGGAVAISHKTYPALVQADDDLVGLVAYALYKRDKLKFCDEFRSRSGRAADTAELDIFIQSCNLSTRLQGYRSQAEVLLERMSEYQLEAAIAEVEVEANQELARKLSEAKSWWRSVAEALLGSVVVAVVWGAIVLVLYTNKIGFDRVAKDIFEIDTGGSRQVQPSAPAASR